MGAIAKQPSEMPNVKGSVQQPGRTNPERDGELLKHRDRGVAPTAFDVADIGTVNVRPVGIILLTPALFLAQATNILSKAKPDFHGDISRPM